MTVLNAGRFVMHRLREAALYPGLARRGPRIAVLPSTGREMSSLLRGYNIAEALGGMGWNAVVLPHQIEWGQRRRFLRLFRPDIALLLGSRHRLNSARLLEGIPFLYDLDDADFHDPRIEARIREDVAAAAGVIAGSAYVADWCRAINPRTTVIWTGSPDLARGGRPQAERARLVTWAQSAPVRYEREFDFVTGVLERMDTTDFTFRLYGCAPEHADHPNVLRIREAGIEVELLPFMPYERFLNSLTEVAVGVSPVIPVSLFSRGKSFGKILAYLSAGVAIIASDEVDHGAFFRPGQGAETGILSNDQNVWAREIAALLEDAPRRAAMVRAASSEFHAHLTLEAAARKVDAVAREVLGR